MKNKLCNVDDCYNEVDDTLIKPDGVPLVASTFCWDCRSKSQRATIKNYRSKNRVYLEATKQLY